MAIHRREFVKLAALVPAAVPLGAADKPVRVGLVGVGHRGSGHVKLLLGIPGVEIAAICDIDADNLATAQANVEKAGRPKPAGYTGEEDFRRMAERNDVDAVITATPWRWHTPI